MNINPPILTRQLTQYKIDYAHNMIDSFEDASGSYLVEMHATNFDVSITNPVKERNWIVHYIFVYNDNERQMRVVNIHGTYEEVKSMFKLDLMA